MEDPFASLTGGQKSAPVDSSTERNPFDALAVESKKRRRLNRGAISAMVFLAFLLAIWFVPRALNPETSDPGAGVAVPELQDLPQEQSPQEGSTVQESPSEPVANAQVDMDVDQSLFSAPSDLPGLIETVTASTLIIECAVSASAEEADFGSGFVVDIAPLIGTATPEIVIVTNQHVIENCESGNGALFVGSGDEYYESSVLGFDRQNDLAVIDASVISRSPIQLTDQIELGQWIMTSGSPIDLESNVTFGQVTSLNTPSEVGGEDAIAHDAVIGPGNSGGPLVNSLGEVLAVNSAYYANMPGVSISVPIMYLCISILECS